ncbi:MAG: ABC transporter ATP-binding protein [Anaerolineales bacterium]|jgi:ABC-2 type transport system ATP-binding protein
MNNLSVQPVIKTDGLTRYFGDFLAVDNVTFQINQGEVVGYLGPNGSGKTTTIRMLLGLLQPSKGSATVLGYDSVQQSEQVRSNSGYMSQKFSLYWELTVSENLAFYAGIYGVKEKERVEEILDITGLHNVQKQQVNQLSTGWRQRLALGTAIVHNPPLLFLDEPTSGVDPNARRAFWDLIYDYVGRGATALVTTHYMDEAEYCGRVGIMRDGQLLAMDDPASLKKNALPGNAWDVIVNSGSMENEIKDSANLLTALNALNDCECVIRAGLASDHLRAITPENVTAETFQNSLIQIGLENFRLEPVEPSLEDVFLALASRRKDPNGGQ